MVYKSLRFCLWLTIFRASAVCVGQLDSAFVETFNAQSRANGGLRYRDNTAEFSVNDETTLELVNRGLAFRIGGRYRWIGYTASIPLSDLGTDEELGEGSSLGLNLQLFRDRFYVNFAGRRTVGFNERRVDQPDQFRRDIKFTNLFAFGFYVLNYRQFSIRSAFRQRALQLQSSGSWLLGGLVHRQILTANSLDVPFSEDGQVTIDRFSQTKLGIGGGYSYTYVFGKHYFVTPLAVVGPEFRLVDYDLRTGERELEGLRVNIRLRTRLAFGFNTRRSYVALIAAYLPSIDNTRSFNARTDETRIELAVGFRFGLGKSDGTVVPPPAIGGNANP